MNYRKYMENITETLDIELVNWRVKIKLKQLFTVNTDLELCFLIQHELYHCHLKLDSWA